MIETSHAESDALLAVITGDSQGAINIIKNMTEHEVQNLESAAWRLGNLCAIRFKELRKTNRTHISDETKTSFDNQLFNVPDLDINHNR